jgi:hypothetical protein
MGHGPLRSLPGLAFVTRRRRCAARCEAAGPEKLEAYSPEYVEDFSGPTTTKIVADHSPYAINERSVSDRRLDIVIQDILVRMRP